MHGKSRMNYSETKINRIQFDSMNKINNNDHHNFLLCFLNLII